MGEGGGHTWGVVKGKVWTGDRGQVGAHLILDIYMLPCLLQ